MLRIDKAILDTSGVICDNIARFGATERGLLSQNILGHIRNFVEYVAIKAFSMVLMLILMIIISMLPL